MNDDNIEKNSEQLSEEETHEEITETYFVEEINEGDNNVATSIKDENDISCSNENTMDKTSNNYENEIQTEANTINNENTMDANTNGCSLASSDNNQRYYLLLFLHLL